MPLTAGNGWGAWFTAYKGRLWRFFRRRRRTRGCWTALNAALDAGARTAFCAVPALYPALRTLGFRGPENEGASGREPVQAEILDLFSKGCPGGCAGIAGK